MGLLGWANVMVFMFLKWTGSNTSMFSTFSSVSKTRKEWLASIPYPIVFLALGLFIVWSVIGYFRDFPRLYLYGALAMVSVIATGTNVTNNPLGVFTWSLTSAVMIVIGIVLLIKFVKTYPLPKK